MSRMGRQRHDSDRGRCQVPGAQCPVPTLSVSRMHGGVGWGIKHPDQTDTGGWDPRDQPSLPTLSRLIGFGTLTGRVRGTEAEREEPGWRVWMELGKPWYGMVWYCTVRIGW